MRGNSNRLHPMCDASKSLQSIIINDFSVIMGRTKGPRGYVSFAYCWLEQLFVMWVSSQSPCWHTMRCWVHMYRNIMIIIRDEWSTSVSKYNVSSQAHLRDVAGLYVASQHRRLDLPACRSSSRFKRAKNIYSLIIKLQRILDYLKRFRAQSRTILVEKHFDIYVESVILK